MHFPTYGIVIVALQLDWIIFIFDFVSWEIQIMLFQFLAKFNGESVMEFQHLHNFCDTEVFSVCCFVEISAPLQHERQPDMNMCNVHEHCTIFKIPFTGCQLRWNARGK